MFCNLLLRKALGVGRSLFRGLAVLSVCGRQASWVPLAGWLEVVREVAGRVGAGKWQGAETAKLATAWDA